MSLRPGWNDDLEANRSAGVVRPYALTGGRTLPSVHLPLEATIAVRGGTDVQLARLDDVERHIVQLGRRSLSVAEISVELHQPIGVTRVLLADLVHARVLEIRATLTQDTSTADRRSLIERTLRGLRAL